MPVTIIGPGALGSAVARTLYTAGIKIEEIVYRSADSSRRAKALAKTLRARPVSFEAAELAGSVLWICVSDSAISGTAASMAGRRSWQRTIVFHSSGALSSDELMALRKKGAKVASVHPMMTFVRRSAPSMKGVAFALEGDSAAVAAARELVKALGGYAFVLAKKDKPLYHALGAFASPLVIAQMAAAERIGRKLGLPAEETRKVIAPILQQTIRNYIEHGPAAAFSGPIARGDAATVRKNLMALRRVRGASEIYLALGKVAVEELPSKDATAIKKVVG